MKTIIVENTPATLLNYVDTVKWSNDDVKSIMDKLHNLKEKMAKFNVKVPVVSMEGKTLNSRPVEAKNNLVRDMHHGVIKLNCKCHKKHQFPEFLQLSPKQRFQIIKNSDKYLNCLKLPA